MSYASWPSTAQSLSNPQIPSHVFDNDTDSEIYSIGQEEDFDAAKQKALKIGAKECYIVRASQGMPWLQFRRGQELCG